MMQILERICQISSLSHSENSSRCSVPLLYQFESEIIKAENSGYEVFAAFDKKINCNHKMPLFFVS